VRQRRGARAARFYVFHELVQRSRHTLCIGSSGAQRQAAVAAWLHGFQVLLPPQSGRAGRAVGAWTKGSKCFAHTTRPAPSFGSSAPGEELFTPEPDARDLRVCLDPDPSGFRPRCLTDALSASSRSIASLTLRCSAST
jgi:hypothetical protein